MSSLFDVSGKSIVIAGGAGGIGAPLATFLHHQGAQLTLCDINTDNAFKGESGVSHRNTLQADIRNASDCRALMKHAQERFDKIDVVINAVGVLPIVQAASMDAETFRKCLDTNVTAALLLSQAAKEFMHRGGAIIHIASVSSLVSNTGYAAYAASKAALAQLVKVIAREWAADGIRVNAIGPALVETPLTADYLSDAEFRANAIDSIPMKRLARVEDLYGAVLLLSSTASEFITGQTIYVDGGRTLV